MKHAPQQDYGSRSRIAVLALVALLCGVSFIPPQTVGNVKLRRANILSEILVFDDASLEETQAEPQLFDAEEYEVDMEEVAQLIVADTLPARAETTFEWIVGEAPENGSEAAAPADILPDDRYPQLSESLPGARRSISTLRPDTTRLSTARIPIEAYDTTATHSFRAFCDTLLAAHRPVRIAVLGDSFIEGDILTADLRELLQKNYGGGGAGFAPIASPLTAFRRSIKTQSKGWTAYNIMQRKAAPEALRSNFYVSGWVCQPAAGASTRWETTDFREKLDDCTMARILFLSPCDSRVEVTLDDSLRREFAVSGDGAVRQIVVRAPRIRSLALRLLEGSERFVGYGAQFEGDGVTVDNYSVRSNNGQAMFWTNPSINAQIDALLRYDLVILQYGLNIMQQGVKNYTTYAAQIEKMIAFVRECFPSAAVLVLGVSERSVKGDTGFRPMDAVAPMTAFQRQAARNAGAAFWPTSEAMRAEGGMERFVRNGWAGKDFTHINYAGGRCVARALYDAVTAELCRICDEQAARQRQAEPGILDSARRATLDRQLLPSAEELFNPAL